MKTPIAFVIFNRPDTTKRVFEAIRQAQPPQLLVIADGPRSDRPNEADRCAETRAIINQVDWECEVSTNYSDVNLGCQRRVSSGLNWAFELVEEAIILEDDCLPDPTFFPFCETLLQQYRDDHRIAVISGQNIQFGRQRTEDSYYFSRYNHCWGWASWRRAWQNFDFEMKLWPYLREEGWLMDILHSKQTAKYWTEIFQKTYDHEINSWAIRWTYSCWLNHQLSILSNVNLISNIGFGSVSTHTDNSEDKFSNMLTQSLDFPLKHPPFMIRDTQADAFTHKVLYESYNNPWNRIRSVANKLKKVIR